MEEVNYEDIIWERIEFAEENFAKGYLMALLDEKLITIDQWHITDMSEHRSVGHWLGERQRHRLSDKNENREVNK
ncbi:hypothetical protein LCGC14_2292970 [marine sediment metagenome]|uniref:Uncharacterized protein n=1 Tax=marine sediment metagenome TaxID=412755 RepID=A0A0F9F366_9ZZZZ